MQHMLQSDKTLLKGSIFSTECFNHKDQEKIAIMLGPKQFIPQSELLKQLDHLRLSATLPKQD